MAVPTFTLPYFGTPPYFSGTASSSLVPHTFPVAIDGRPFMIDQKSGQFKRGYEQRVRDSTDDSTSPGEGAINPGGLWRRGQDSWHSGAGQVYADTADSQNYRFYKSKGIDPWTKGQLSLLNATKRSLESANTNLFSCVVESDGTEYLYVADGNVVRFSSNPYAATPTWTAVTTNTAGGAVPDHPITGLETNGTNVFIAWEGHDIWYTATGTTTATLYFKSGSSNLGNNLTYNAFGYAKGRGWAAVNNSLFAISPVSSPAETAPLFTNPDVTFRWVGAAAGQNAVYAAGRAGDKSLIYKVTITSAGVLDSPVVALELPVGEQVTAIHGYLGFIVLGSNKGVRFCSTDAQSNLLAGSLIPTTGAVNDFTSSDRFIWFTYTNYDGVSSGLGRLDLSVFTAPNTPAYATDLMYTNTGAVKSVASIGGKRVFTISGVGVVVEDSANLVASGEIETGTWRWGIPDRKFVAKIDTRSSPLIGAITSYLKLDDGEYQEVGVWDTGNDIENSFDGSDTRAIEAAFKFTLARSSTATATGPTFTRWMARAYAAPFRSQVFVVPVLLHQSVTVRGKEYYYDVEEQQTFFDGLIGSPRIITLQIGSLTHSVILEDLQWDAADSSGNTWQFNGTLVVTLRSVEN
jgi:hypothetical protein